jgi:sugar/nucleoside kinase (ribokinase family)
VHRVGVLGTLVCDRLWTYEATQRGDPPLEDWGGICYTLISMAAALPQGWEVVPIVKIGSDVADRAGAFFSSVPGLVLGEGIRVEDEPNNRVELRYHSESDRTELQTGGRPSWTAAELEPVLGGLDALYVNFISGFEMELREAERLRRSYRGPVYADLHSIFLGRDAAGRRSYRPLPEWERWLAAFDAVQLNRDELRTLAAAEADLDTFVERAMLARTGLVALTLGEQGAACVRSRGFPADPRRWAEHRDRVERDVAEWLVLPLSQGPLQGDPTGCGDVWGGAFFASLLGGAELGTAAARAHRAATRKLLRSGASGIYEELRAELGSAPPVGLPSGSAPSDAYGRVLPSGDPNATTRADRMTRVITVPPTLDETAFDAIVEESRAAGEGRLLLDARHVRWADPFGMLGLLAFGQQALREGTRALLHAPDSAEVNSYLSRMAFFENAAELFEVHGAPAARRSGGPSNVLLEITPIRSHQDVHHVIDHLQERAGTILTERLSFSRADSGTFSMVLSEVCQNIIEHAEDGGWVGIQTYNWARRLGRQVVQIAVMDLGVGFRGSLAKEHATRFGDQWSDATALEAAFLHHVTRFRDPGRGQGLRQIRRTVSRWKGKISIRSGTARFADVPEWDDAQRVQTDLAPFPGAQIQILLPAHEPNPAP